MKLVKITRTRDYIYMISYDNDPHFNNQLISVKFPKYLGEFQEFKDLNKQDLAFELKDTQNITVYKQLNIKDYS